MSDATKRTRSVLRFAGWLIAFGGSVTAILCSWIDHMNWWLWRNMMLGVVVSVVVGSLLLWFAREPA